jgi:hypothetical protein
MGTAQDAAWFVVDQDQSILGGPFYSSNAALREYRRLYVRAAETYGFSVSL